MPFDLIIDERNAPAEIYVPGVTEITTRVDPGKGCDVPLTDDAALPSLRLDGFRGRQTHRIIFYGEKSSLAVVLRPIAEKIGAEIILVTGESSHTRIEEAARRACEDGRPAVLFYFADFDPSGHQMPVSVARKLQAFRDLKFPNLNIKLYPVALTLDQVRSWNLPSAPLKETEKRAAAWKEKHDGHEQTEIDAAVALRPDELRAAVFDALAPFYDDSLDHRVADVEAEWRRTADDALQDHPDYEAVSERIKTAWKDVDDAVRKLHSEQREAAELLESSIPEAPELPEAEPPGEAKPALFDTNDDFVTSSRRLFRHKKLMEEED